MWTVWMPVGFLLLATKRYFKKQWSCMHFTHSLLGYFCMLTTTIWTFKMLDYFDWKVNDDIHSIAGIFASCLTLVVGLSGSLTAGMMQFKDAKPWKARESVTSVGKFHRYAGYFMLFIGNATAMSGIQHYFADIVMDQQASYLGLISLCTFCLLVIVCEIFYYRVQSKSDMVVETPVEQGAANKNFMVYTSEQIDKGVAAGIPLLLFDNLVLNAAGFEKIHPGGKFAIQQNYGRDISKFFNGGYSLV